ncbi:MAG: hypothetical protein ACKV1O_14045 [Saprospiraceae bacterium]
MVAWLSGIKNYSTYVAYVGLVIKHGRWQPEMYYGIEIIDSDSDMRYCGALHLKTTQRLGLQIFWRRCRRVVVRWMFLDTNVLATLSWKGYKYYGGDAATNIMAAMPLGGEHSVFLVPETSTIEQKQAEMFIAGYVISPDRDNFRTFLDILGHSTGQQIARCGIPKYLVYFRKLF